MNIKTKWHIFRTTRNSYLAETDKYMLADYPISTTIRGKYREYRQYLRDCPKMFSDSSIFQAKVKTFEEWLEWRRNGDY